MKLKAGVWAVYEKKNRVPNPEVQKMPGRPIRSSGKEMWGFPGWRQGIGPFEMCFRMWTHVGYIMVTVFFFFLKK